MDNIRKVFELSKLAFRISSYGLNVLKGVIPVKDDLAQVSGVSGAKKRIERRKGELFLFLSSPSKIPSPLPLRKA